MAALMGWQSSPEDIPNAWALLTDWPFVIADWFGGDIGASQIQAEPPGGRSDILCGDHRTHSED